VPVRFVQSKRTTMAHATSATTVALPLPARDASTLRRRRARLGDPLPANARIGSWRVEGELGRGGMASVHAVVHTKFGKRAAIKLAHRDLVGERLPAATFLREARIVHKVDHPGVIDVFATGSCEGRPYLVMERLIGASLGRRLDPGPLPAAEAIETLLELCDVLRATHAAGVVHRDIKLDNVFVCDRPFAGDKRVKLLDWGVAHVVGEADPFCGLIAGTLVYVAPEQIRGEVLTPAADLYSLAVLAYHLLCGRPPFTASSDLALVQQHLRGTPPPPSAAGIALPASLEAILLAMLAKHPEQRPTLDEIERELRAALAVSVPRADPPLAAPATPTLSGARAPRRGLTLPRVPRFPAPPFRLGWVVAAGAVIALAALVSAISA
jgi:eukaryotic-like serine/threonine-protein kinase